jgi:hypothetical protein
VRNNSKGFAPILIILVIVAVVIVGYFVYRNYRSTTQPIIQPTASVVTLATPVQVTQSTSPTPSDATNSTANWKTYINSQYKFSFKYPNTYTTEMTNYTGFLTTISLIDPKYGEMYIVGLSDTGQESVGCDSRCKITTIKVDGYDAVDYGLPEVQNPAQQIVQFSRNGLYFQFQFPDDENQTELDTFNQILSTFKFTN